MVVQVIFNKVDSLFKVCIRFYPVLYSNLMVHSILTMYEKNFVEVSVRKNFGVVINSFSQFHSTFIRKHSRFFLRIGHKPQSVVQVLYNVQ